MNRALSCLLVLILAGSLASCGKDSGEKITDNNTPSTWERTIGGEAYERANAVIPGADGGYVIAGTIGLEDGSDVYLVKIDNDGGIAWERTIGGSGRDEALSIVTTADGGYLLAGNTNSMGYGQYDAYLLKVDASGNMTWSNAYGGSASDHGAFASAIADGYLLAGSALGAENNSPSVVLVYTLPTGSLREQDVLTGSEGVTIIAGAATADGGMIVAGTDARPGSFFPDVYLLRIDNTGSVLWEHTFTGVGGWAVGPNAIIQVGEDFVIAGSAAPDGGASDAYLAKVDGAGNLVWQKKFGSDHDDVLQAAAVTPDGGQILAGWTEAAIIRGSDVYLVKTNADGVVEWERTFGGDSFDEGFGVTTTPEGGYLVVGRTASFGTGGGDLYVIKTDAEGRVANADQSL